MATISKTWTNSWILSSDLGSTIPSSTSNLSTAVQERMQNLGLYWPATSDTTCGLLYASPNAFNAGYFDIFDVTGGIPDTTKKLFSVSASAIALNKPTTVTGVTGITGNTTITGDLAVSGTLTAGTIGGSTRYYTLNCSMQQVYDSSISSYVWPISSLAANCIAIPNHITSATLLEVRVDTGYQAQMSPIPITMTVRNPTYSSTDITASTQTGSSQDLSITHGYFGRRIISGFTCPTTLTAGQQIRFVVDATIGNRGGSNPNFLTFTIVFSE